MLRTFCRWTSAALLSGCLLLPSAASADENEGLKPVPANGNLSSADEAVSSGDVVEAGPGVPAGHGHHDLFQNYWVPPYCGALGAQLYVAPQPVPPVVGHTYFTYQPLMPHELMYPHHHTYYRYYDGGRGMTRAKVVYYRPPVRSAVGHVITHFRIPR